jgi:AcrR family transcriptional regulator
MDVLPVTGRRGPRTVRPSLLDVATDVLVENPGASLAAVAEAAGIGRTTLHKQYATREDLLRAVGHRALDLCEQAVAAVEDGADGGLRSLIAALIQAGPALAFLWRSPTLDRDDEIGQRWRVIESAILARLRQARDLDLLRPGVPGWWLTSTLFSVVYTAHEAIQGGLLAPLDAPGLALETLLHGVGP